MTAIAVAATKAATTTKKEPDSGVSQPVLRSVRSEPWCTHQMGAAQKTTATPNAHHSPWIGRSAPNASQHDQQDDPDEVVGPRHRRCQRLGRFDRQQSEQRRRPPEGDRSHRQTDPPPPRRG